MFSKVQQITTSGGGFSPLRPWSSAKAHSLAHSRLKLPHDLCTARANYEKTARDSAPRELTGEDCSEYLYYTGLNRSTSPCTVPWSSLEGDNRYLYKRL